MSESAQDLAKRLLADAGRRTAAPAVPTVETRRTVRGPGHQFSDHPAVATAVMRRELARTASEQAGLPVPLFVTRQGPNEPLIDVAGRELLNFSSYNYLGLAHHPRVTEAAAAALDRYGASASASRIVAGEIPLYQELEQRLAESYGVGDAVTTTSGFMTNAGVIGFLLREGDVAICDSLIHGSVVAGTQWAGCRRLNFRHNDPDSLRSVLRTSRAGFDRALVVLEGLYSMDGDIGRIDELAMVAREYNCAVMVDEAHSFGVFGAHGYGIREHFDLPGDAVDIWMGTLSKALGSVGGFVAGDADLIYALKAVAPGVAILTGGPAPSAIAAALAALDVLAEEPERLTRLWDNARTFQKLMLERGLDLADAQGTPVCPVIVPGEANAGYAAALLLQQGVNVGAISAPIVPEGKERLRFFLTSEHTEQQLRATTDLVAKAVEQARKLPM